MTTPVMATTLLLNLVDCAIKARCLAFLAELQYTEKVEGC
jgi:hypothetical protein